jgi:general secretion pathway protein D
MRRLIAAALAICALALGSCATRPYEEPIPEAQQLLAAGKYEQALALLKQAADKGPDNSRYRADYYRARGMAVNQLLAQADNALRSGEPDAAEALYNRAARIDPGNERAPQGLDAVARERREAPVIAAANEAFEAGRLSDAEAKLRPVLTENPRQRTALALERRIAEERARLAAAPPALDDTAQRHKVSLQFRDAPLRAVFDIVSRAAGINFVFDRDIRADARTTISVKEATVGQVIDMLLVANQLAKKVVDSRTILVYPDTPQKRRAYQELVVKSFYLANADAKRAQNLLKTILKTRDVYVDDQLGLLVMRDTPEAVRLAEKLIAAQDLAEPEVVLDVEVLEVTRSKLQQIGIQWPSQITLTPTGSGTAGGSPTPGTLTLDEARNLTSKQVQVTVTNPFIALNLQQTDGQSNLLANPRIRVMNHEKASIHIGDRVPVITTTAAASGGFVSQSINYLDVGLKLEVQPTISLDNDVSMKVNLEVSNIVREVTGSSASGGTLAYQIGTRTANTVLQLKDGETEVLAGLISDEDRRTAARVPGVGELPVLGRLFSTHGDNATKTEIVLLITPHVVRGLERPDARTAEFRSGTEAEVGAGAIGGGATLAAPPRRAAPAPNAAPTPPRTQ